MKLLKLHKWFSSQRIVTVTILVQKVANRDYSFQKVLIISSYCLWLCPSIYFAIFPFFFKNIIIHLGCMLWPCNLLSHFITLRRGVTKMLTDSGLHFFLMGLIQNKQNQTKHQKYQYTNAPIHQHTYLIDRSTAC